VDDGGTTAYDELPERRITAGQLVAWNLARLRRAAGMRQDELGDLIGWDKKAVSSAERSWEKRPRQFEIGTVLAMARALHVPLAAFLLPPDDDGVACRYVIDGAQEMPMHTLVTYVTSDAGEEDTPALNYYRQRLAAVQDYLDPARTHDLAGTFDAYTSEELILGRMEALQRNYDDLRRIALDFDGQMDGLDRKLRELRGQ
jgi:transcriptional regulator with XRE-family HTH domain